MVQQILFWVLLSFVIHYSQGANDSNSCVCVKRNKCNTGNILSDSEMLLLRSRPVCLDDQVCCNKLLRTLSGDDEEDEGAEYDYDDGDGEVSENVQKNTEEEEVTSEDLRDSVEENPYPSEEVGESEEPSNEVTEKSQDFSVTHASLDEVPSTQSESASKNTLLGFIYETTTTNSRSKTDPELKDMFICGVRSFDFSGLAPKINTADGDDSWTQPGDFPWMLLIKYFVDAENPNDQQLVCGASLILPNVAMTAAHCVDRKKSENLVVRAGEWELGTEEETIPAQERGVRQVIIHPKYDPRPLMYDLALLILDEPFESSATVNTICIPPDDEPLMLTDKCYATGWGAIREDASLTVEENPMRKTKLALVSRGDCEALYRKGPLTKFYRLHKSFLCAGGDGLGDTCLGDGGGPLACETVSSPGVFYVIGVTSWGVGCSRKGLPGAYTNVSALTNWIYSSLTDISKSNSGEGWSYRLKKI